MAFATEDFGWGKVEILYNKQPAQNLHIITVQVINDSQNDLSAVQLNMQVSDGTIVLRGMAQIRGSLDALPLASGYAALLAEGGKRKLTDPELAILSKRSDFLAPVLNRGCVIDARLLVARQDHLTPSIVLQCNHLGVRLRHEPPAVQIWGVNQQRASLVGFLIGFLVVVFVVSKGGATWGGGLVTWLVGSLGIALGAAAALLWRLLMRLFG